MEEKKGKKGKGAGSMIAPHPYRQGGELRPVEDLAREAGLKEWEAAGLMRAARWAPGKQVTKEQFEAALAAFRNRPQGGGRI